MITTYPSRNLLITRPPCYLTRIASIGLTEAEIRAVDRHLHTYQNLNLLGSIWNTCKWFWGASACQQAEQIISNRFVCNATYSQQRAQVKAGLCVMDLLSFLPTDRAQTQPLIAPTTHSILPFNNLCSLQPPSPTSSSCSSQMSEENEGRYPATVVPACETPDEPKKIATSPKPTPRSISPGQPLRSPPPSTSITANNQSPETPFPDYQEACELDARTSHDFPVPTPHPPSSPSIIASPSLEEIAKLRRHLSEQALSTQTQPPRPPANGPTYTSHKPPPLDCLEGK